MVQGIHLSLGDGLNPGCVDQVCVPGLIIYSPDFLFVHL